MRVSPQQKKHKGATMFVVCCQQNLSMMWFLTLSKSPHIFKPAQEWILADSNLITDLCVVCNCTHTHTHTVCFSCVIAFYENTHARSPTHTIATCRNRLARRKSLPTYSLPTTPKSAPSDSDTMMMTLPWQLHPLVSRSSGESAFNGLDSIFKWWRPFGNKVSAGSHSTSSCSAKSNRRLTQTLPKNLKNKIKYRNCD